MQTVKKMPKSHEKMSPAEHKKAMKPIKKVNAKKSTYSLGKPWMKGFEIVKNGKATWEYTMTKDKASFLKLKNKK